MKKLLTPISMIILLFSACQSGEKKGLEKTPDVESLQGYWLADDSTGYLFQSDGQAKMISDNEVVIESWSLNEGPLLTVGLTGRNQSRLKELSYEFVAFTEQEMEIRLQREETEEGEVEKYKRIPDDSIYLYRPFVFGKLISDNSAFFFEDCLTGKRFEISNDGAYSAITGLYDNAGDVNKSEYSIAAEGAINKETGKLVVNRLFETAKNDNCKALMPDYYLAWVGPERRECSSMDQKGCLQIKFYNKSFPYMDLDTDIQGFQHERGMEYELILEEISDTSSQIGPFKLMRIVDRELVKPNVDLMKMRWRLLSIKGEAVPEYEDAPYLRFSEADRQGKIEGYSGCNPVAGTFALRDNNRIDLGLRILETEPCPEEDPTLETRFIKNSMICDNYEIDGDKLTLFKKEAPYMVFEAMYYE